VASDGDYYATKFANNPQHMRVLANEMFAGELARYLGLPVATMRVIDVPERLVKETPSLCIEVGHRIFPCSAGKQLASRYVSAPTGGSPHDYLPDREFERVSNLGDSPRVLVLDKWTANCDGRQVVFTPDATTNDSYAATFRFGAMLLRIPAEWYEQDLDGLRRITEALYRRRVRIRDLITDFRRSTRNPFPNWKNAT